jgi:hypothetical protein
MNTPLNKSPRLAAIGILLVLLSSGMVSLAPPYPFSISYRIEGGTNIFRTTNETFAPYVLQGTTNLSNPVAWTNLTGGIANTMGVIELRYVPSSNTPTMFFRLQKF